MAELLIRELYKSYGDVEVLRGINLQIEHGEFCVFVGPSGCGKSTLLKVIAGLEPETSGDILLDGSSINHVHAANRGLAMVFQSYALYPHMRVRENMSFALENMRMPKSEISQRVESAAKMLQLEALLDRKPTALSGGQRQRVAIGRAVVREPKIFLFDEPLSNLDAELRVQMRNEIAGLHRRLGNTMIYVTHDQVEAMTLANKIVVLRDGAVEQIGPPLELYNRPANVFVAGFIGSPKMNFLDVSASQVDAEWIQLSGGGFVVRVPTTDFALGDAQELTMGIRANHLESVTPENADQLVTVENIEQLGAESHIFARTSDGADLIVHSPGQTRAKLGDKIGISLSREDIHLFDRETGVSVRRST
jgi:multiple sugar transport system ATP-binding protein